MTYRSTKPRPAPSEREQAVINHLFAFSAGNSFYSDLLAKSMKYVLSEGQMACVERNMATDAERAERKAQMIAEGKVVKQGKNLFIAGEVVSVKIDNTDGQVEFTKIIIEQGNQQTRLWGKIPTMTLRGSDIYDLAVGDIFSCVANVTKSSNDPTFGFFTCTDVTSLKCAKQISLD